MQQEKILLSLFILCCSIIASQTVTKVELSRDNGIIFNQSGEITIINESWNEQQNFDLSLELGNCQTVCGARCPLNILSKGIVYVYKNDQDSFPLYGRNIDFNSDEFYTSSQHLNYSAVQVFSIPMVDYPKYMVVKSTVNKYFLFIIDSLKISGGCLSEDPLCCSAYEIDKIYGKIIFQDNGLPFFDPAVSVKRNQKLKYHKLNSDISSKVIDIQGRSISNQVNSSGVRINTSTGLNQKRTSVKTQIK